MEALNSFRVLIAQSVYKLKDPGSIPGTARLSLFHSFQI
jgi:hypothetical protein